MASLDNLHDASCADPVGNLAPLDSGIISTARPSPPANVTDNNDPILAYGDPSPFILPSEAVTRELIAQYFSNTGLLYPYIHEPSFFKEYDELVANGFKKARRTWLALLHIVLAMSSSTLVVDTKEERQKRNLESSLFYARAVKLCDLQTLQVTSLETGKRDL